jgi:hypothetical protein
MEDEIRNRFQNSSLLVAPMSQLYPVHTLKTRLRNMQLHVSLCLGQDRLCGQVVRVPGYRSRDPGFRSWHYQIFCEVVGLERGPLSP